MVITNEFMYTKFDYHLSKYYFVITSDFMFI